MRAYPCVEPAAVAPEAPCLSTAFEDAYFSLTDPWGERHALFIEGLGLPELFKSLNSGDCLRIGETGFGAGLSFLMAASQFLTEAPSGARLQWISTERYPLSAPQVEAMWRSSAMPAHCRGLAAQLLIQWPEPIACPHRRVFGEGRVVLDLHHQDALAVFTGLTGTVDAWCLDGFSPDRNESLWNDSLYAALARMSRPGTAFSTFTAATRVRQGLESAGFVVHKKPGYLGKRERLSGHFARPLRPSPWPPRLPQKRPDAVTIVGAGLSGAWLARRLADRGVAVTVLERHQPAQGASGNPQGIAYAKLSVEATPASLVQLQALAHLSTWLADVPDGIWHPTGLLILAADAAQSRQQTKLIHALSHNPEVIEPVSVHEASDLAGQHLAANGLWIPKAGWMQPNHLVTWLLDDPRITVAPYTTALGMTATEGGHALTVADPDGQMHTHGCEVVVWANASEARQFSAMALPLKPVRGQITVLRRSIALHVPVSGQAYVAPSVGGLMTCGATYAPHSTDLKPRSEDNEDNLSRTNALFKAPHFSSADIAGERVSLRATTPDYAPLVGQLADPIDWQERLEPLTRDAHFLPTDPLPYLTGQYVLAAQGSRGTLTAPMTAEILASQITGELLPVHETIREALSPDRFFRRSLIRQGSS